jgi:hypothetical protein
MSMDKAPPLPSTLPLSTPLRPEPGEALLRFFIFEHLPPKLAQVSQPFASLAQQIVSTIPASPERTVALRKLLESKVCAVRAAL